MGHHGGNDLSAFSVQTALILAHSITYAFRSYFSLSPIVYLLLHIYELVEFH